MSASLVKENDKIILKKDKNSKIFNVVLGKKCSFCKEKFYLDKLIGERYGAWYKVEGDQLIKMTLSEINSKTSDKAELVDDETSSNKHLYDDQTNQKLKKEEIESLKSKGVAGEVIIEQLVKNSTTFDSKTEFSKQKYIKRKTKKHLTTFNLLECNTRNLLDMYYSRGPTKICNLRMDSLAQVLNASNVRHNGRYLVVDGCSGLLTGAMLERLDGSGLVLNLYIGSAPSRPAVELGYNFEKRHLKVLKDFPLSHLYTIPSISNTSNQQVTINEPQCESENIESIQSIIKDLADDDIACKDDDITEEVENVESDDANKNKEKKEKASSKRKDVSSSKRGKRKAETLEERNKRRMKRQKELSEVREVIEEAKMDGLIVCTKGHISNLIITLLPLLKTGRPLVLFSPHREPLVACYTALKQTRQAIMLRMFETWLRQYQILEGRSHPLVNMSGTGGCILTAVKIEEECSQLPNHGVNN